MYKKIIHIIIFYIVVNISFAQNFTHLIGIMSQFQEENPDNGLTSGLGTFLDTDLDISDRCDGFIVDALPHDSNYFLNQMKSVKNYYNTISNGNVDFEIHVIDEVYQLSHDMEYYAKSDLRLSELFMESIGLAKSKLDSYFLSEISITSSEDVLIVVFHAGLGQDISVPFIDPTSYDIKSAYIEPCMYQNSNLESIETNIGQIEYGILLPETENLIFFDVIQDVFGDYDSYCNYQFGMTGIFSFLLGYHLELPPLYYNNKPGVGAFGLMDTGSGNGWGLIPSPPTAWTRIKMGWDSATEINIDSLFPEVSFDNSDSTLIINSDSLIPFSADTKIPIISRNDVMSSGISDTENIYKINIDEDEYFLIEFTSNKGIYNDFIIDEIPEGEYSYIDQIRAQSMLLELESWHYRTGTSDYPIYYFDKLQETLIDKIILSDDNKYIIGFDNYDYGISSGLLIWHIKEPSLSDMNEDSDCEYFDGFNGPFNNRYIHLEEADGAVDIGNASFAFFESDDPTGGTPWDLWYNNNQRYKQYGNPNSDKVVFDDNSYPNTRTTDNAKTSIKVLFPDFDTGLPFFNDKDGNRIMLFSLELSADFEILNLPNLGSKNIMGNDGDGTVFLSDETSIYMFSYNSNDIEELAGINILDDSCTSPENLDILFYLDHIYCRPSDSSNQWMDGEILPTINNTNMGNQGYVETYDIIKEIDFAHSLGDIDEDGLDEVIYIENDALHVVNYSENTDKDDMVPCNGFPVYGTFSSVPLIADIYDDSNVDIIVRNDDFISIFSNKGINLLNIASENSSKPLSILRWNNKIALIDGNRLILFDKELDADKAFWLNPESRASGYSLSSGLHSSSSFNSYISQSKSAYIYPNPIYNDIATFRYFLSQNDDVKITIYDLNGFMIEELDCQITISGDYNECEFKVSSKYQPGVYFATIKSGKNYSELIKFMVLR